MTNQRGIGIIEIMIGIVIGMIGCVAIFQIMATADGRKRTLVAGADAQASGSIGLYQLERDLALAGFGAGRLSSDYYGCNVRGRDNTRGVDVTFTLTPIQVFQGAGSTADRLEVLVGSSAVVTGPIAFNGSSATTKSLASRAGFFVGDVLVAGLDTTVTPRRCALFEVSRPEADDFSIEHIGRRFNATPPLAATLTSSGEIINLGPRPRLMRWAVINGRLTVTDLLATSVTPMVTADNVVDLQAQYGYDADAIGTTGFGTIQTSEWLDELPAGADWSRVLAIRAAILVRSEQAEREIVTTDAQAPVWRSAGIAFDMTHGANSEGEEVAGAITWKNYRYRVYESVVTLRNMVWGKQ